MARQPSSLQEAAEWLRKRFDAESSCGLNLGYAFELGGERGGTLGVLVEDGRLEIGPGAPRRCDVTLRLAAEELFAVLAGRENADMLFMAGRLQVEGDLALALKLHQLFRAQDRKSTRLNSSHSQQSRMPSSA